MTGPEVTAAMKAEDVDPALVEIIAKRRYEVTRLTDKYPSNWPSWEMLADSDNALTLAYREAFLNGARGDLAAVLPEIQAQALREAVEEVSAMERAFVTSEWGTVVRKLHVMYLLRDRAARLTATTEESTT